MAEAIQLWVRTAEGTLSVSADRGRTTSVVRLRAKIAAMSGCDAAACRLIFAGRELEDGRSLGDYGCEEASELNLVLRVEDLGSADAEAAEQTAAMRARLAGAKLAQFHVLKKIGGKDISAASGAGYSQSGACSYVYLAALRANGFRLAGDKSKKWAPEQEFVFACARRSTRPHPRPRDHASSLFPMMTLQFH